MSGPDASPSGEYVRTRVASAVGGLEMVEARFETHAFPLHAHDEYVIGAVVAGAKATRHGGRTLVADTGCLTLFNPYDEHASVGVGEAWTFVALYPSKALMDAWVGHAPRFSTPVVNDASGAEVIVQLWRRMNAGASALDAQSAFIETMAFFTERHMRTRSTRAHNAPSRARERLDADLGMDLDLTELARLEGVSPLALLRGFRGAYGCTPRVYRTARRIAAAKRELKAGGAIAEIAADLGFCDQGHFTRVFQRWTGGTPGAYARG